MTRRGAPVRTRVPRDPYGIGPVAGYIGPVIGVIALVLIGTLTLNLFNGKIPFLPTGVANGGTGNGGTDGGPGATAAPSGVIVTVPKSAFPGSIVYAKAGNIWVQTGSDAKQLTSSGEDSMPTISADGKSIYFIRIQEGTGKFPTGGSAAQGRSWYDLDTPGLYRMNFDGSGAQRLLYAKYTQGSSTWFYWLRQPVPSPDGKTIVVVSDGPNPLQSDIVLHSYSIKTKKLTALNVPESLHLGQQDPAWRPDGKYLLFVKNGRELTRGAPQIYRYDPAANKSKAVTGPGYLSPAYSPDGAWIAATHTDAFGTDISILDEAGKEVLRVTDDGHSFAPIWSPAGNAVAFLHLEGTIVDLRMATLDDATGHWSVTSTVDLTKVSALDGASRPSWYIPPSELPAASEAPAGGTGASAGTSAAP